MKPICYELLEGTLTWSGSDATTNATVFNRLPMPILVDYVPNPGTLAPYISGIPRTISPYSSGSIYIDPPNYPPGYYKTTIAGTGGLVDVFEVSADVGQDLQIEMRPQWLNVPNDIGPIPIPTSSIPDAPIEPQPSTPRVDSTVIVPPSSPRVVVGCGTASNGNLVVREQFWARQNNSIVLAGNETQTISYTVTSGMEKTSSETDTMSESVGVSGSAGWGPVSASISASLSHSSTTFQQVTVQEQTTSYLSNSITNPHDEPVAYFRWQLTDVITVFDKETLLPVSSLLQGENPSIVMGPYWTTPRMSPPVPSLTSRGDGLFKYK